MRHKHFPLGDFVLLCQGYGSVKNIIFNAPKYKEKHEKTTVKWKHIDWKHFLNRIVWYRMVSYGIVWYRMVSYGIVSYRIVSYRIVSYRIVLYCIELIQKNKWSTPPKKKPKPRLQTLRPSYGKKKKEERIFGIRFFNILLDHIWPWKTASVANWAKYLNSGNFAAGENNNTWNN